MSDDSKKKEITDESEENWAQETAVLNETDEPACEDEKADRKQAPSLDSETAREATAARTDLVAGDRLLETLSKFISVQDNSNGKPGGIVVAAPHHAPSGTPLSGGHDVNTGPIAEQLAEALKGTCVVASELRTLIDLNKNPFKKKRDELGGHLGRLAFRQADWRLKMFYQSQVFASNPLTVIEIHGHKRGLFDFEISTGFQLNDRVQQDKALIAALKAFKEALKRALSNSRAFSRETPTVGVYPLDSEVKFAATGTHTFNKIEKLRELGVNIAGLHIELSRGLRPDPADNESASFYEELINCLELGVKSFVQKVKQPVHFDFKDYLFNDFMLERGGITLLAENGFDVRQIPKELVGRQVVTFCKRDMKRLGLDEGQKVLLASDPEFDSSFELKATTVAVNLPGWIGIAKKNRDKLGLRPGDTVYVGQQAEEDDEGLILAYVSSIAGDAEEESVGVGPELSKKLKKHLNEEGGITLDSVTGERQDVSIVKADSLPHEKAVALSTVLARDLNVTFGDLVCFSPTRAE